jgi:hypothetical protein
MPLSVSRRRLMDRDDNELHAQVLEPIRSGQPPLSTGSLTDSGKLP